jgi:hypothetical protein
MTYPTSVWDGTSPSRDNGDSIRAPDWQDYEKAYEELKAVQTQLTPLCIAANGALRTSPGAGVNEVQSLAAIVAASGTWTLTITLPGNTAVVTAALAFNASAATIEGAIDTACAGLTVGGVAFTASDISCAGGAINANPVTLTFDGASVDKMPIDTCVTVDIDLSAAGAPVVSTTTQGVLPSANPTKTWYIGAANAVKVG